MKQILGIGLYLGPAEDTVECFLHQDREEWDTGSPGAGAAINNKLPCHRTISHAWNLAILSS